MQFLCLLMSLEYHDKTFGRKDQTIWIKYDITKTNAQQKPIKNS